MPALQFCLSNNAMVASSTVVPLSGNFSYDIKCLAQFHVLLTLTCPAMLNIPLLIQANPLIVWLKYTILLNQVLVLL